MESSTDKIKAIFEVIRELDDLDKEAWAKLIHTAEAELEKEIMMTNVKAMKEAEEILNDILPLVRMARLMITTGDISPFQRTIIVKHLMQEFLWLLTPVEAAGTLQTMIYENFKKSEPQMRAVMVVPRQFGPPKKEDTSRTII